MNVFLAAAEKLSPSDQLAQNVMDTGRVLGWASMGILALIAVGWVVGAVVSAFTPSRKPEEKRD